jgi:tetratricopeptide (TPR) repeat protein
MTSENGEKVGLIREERLFEILAAYFAAVEAGNNPDRTKWLAQYPEWAEDIARFMDDQDRLLRLTEPLRPIAEASSDSADGSAQQHGELTVGQVSQRSPATEPQNGSADYALGSKVRYIGDYELLGEIARGGMGVVFRARQRSLNRPVALKMLLAGTLMSGEDEQRFRQEAEAAANLDHPNIVPIFEVGRHDGHRYFSMKLIEGVSLAQRLPDFSDDQRGAARLMAMVARAVHHAHQRGVLHRDLKPSNILLCGGLDAPMGQLEPYVTDFGLAKRAESDPGLTQSGAILGTPSYMAPEQASGKKGVVTVATDVYGLGAVLYAILSGKPPFQGDSALETIAHVKDRSLNPPSSYGRRIDRDLETICLKCLEKEPARRYDSAEAVAEDLERWLAGVPIQARPARRAERAWRWCQRNPLVAALSTAVAALLVAALAGLLVSNRMIAGERDGARQQREKAERHAHQARHAVDQMYTRLAEDWLANQPRLQPMQSEFLALALRFYEEFALEDGDDPEVRREVALAHRRVGQILHKFNDYHRAESALRRSVQIMSDLAATGPARAEDRLQWVESELALGRLLKRNGKADEGGERFRHAVTLCRGLVAENPRSLAFRLALADALVNYEALETLPEAISTFSDMKIEQPDRERCDTILSSAHAHLGSILYERTQFNEALLHHREALRLRAALASKFPDRYAHRTRLLVSMTDLARDLVSLGKGEESLTSYRDALALSRELAEEFPSIPDNHVNVVIGWNNLGSALKALGRLAEAETCLSQGLVAARTLNAKHPYRDTLGSCLLQWGDFLRLTGKLPEARRAFEEVLTCEASVRYVAEARNQLGWLAVATPGTAKVEISRALQLAGQATELMPNEPRYWSILGVAHYRAGAWGSAIKALMKPIELHSPGEDFDGFIMSMAYWQMGEKNEARKWFSEAVGWMAKNKSHDEDVWRLRAEAEALLGIADSRMPNGIDAFREE